MINDYQVKLFRGQIAGYNGFSDIASIHRPDISPECVIYDPVIEEEDNASGTLTFKVPLTNPNVKQILCGSLLEMVNISTGETVWFGRLLQKSVDLYGNVVCTVEGPMGFLKEAFISSVNSPYINDPTATFGQYLEVVIQQLYNNIFGGMTSMYDQYIRPDCLRFSNIYFQNGIRYLETRLSELDDFYTIRVTSSSGIDIRYKYSESNPLTLFDFITNHIHLGLFEVDGKPYGSEFLQFKVSIIQPDNIRNLSEDIPRVSGLSLSIVVEDPNTTGVNYNHQNIDFGDNILDAEIDYDFTNVGTSLMVLGQEYEAVGIEHYKKRYNIIGGTDNKTGGTFLTPYINATNGSIEKYGIIPKTIILDDVPSNDTVILWANLYRNIFSNPIVSFTINAVDLSTINPNLSRIEIGQYCNVHFPGLSDDSVYVYRCTKRRVNLFDPSKSEFTFSYTQSMNISSIRSRTETTVSSLKKSIMKSENTIKNLEERLLKYEQEEDNNA